MAPGTLKSLLILQLLGVRHPLKQEKAQQLHDDLSLLGVSPRKFEDFGLQGLSVPTRLRNEGAAER